MNERAYVYVKLHVNRDTEKVQSMIYIDIIAMGMHPCCT